MKIQYRLIVLSAAIVAAHPLGSARAQAVEGDPTTALETAQPAARQSWTADRREFVVGDIITVLIDERTLATATTGDFALDRRSRDMFATADAYSTRVTGRLGSTNDAESRQRGEAVRQNRFVGEMTVRVTGIEDGVLRVAGERNTNIDRNTQTMSLTGWVRANDVSRDNLVESWRIGDAEIVYASSGDLGKPRGGIITRLLSWIWP